VCETCRKGGIPLDLRPPPDDEELNEALGEFVEVDVPIKAAHPMSSAVSSSSSSSTAAAAAKVAPVVAPAAEVFTQKGATSVALFFALTTTDT
jgi:hypothetical protein